MAGASFRLTCSSGFTAESKGQDQLRAHCSFGVILALGMFSHCYTVPAPPKVNEVHWKLVMGVRILVLKCATGGDFSKWVHGGGVS